MASERPGMGPAIDKSRSIEDLHHLRLMALLDELVRDRGARKAAADLDVDHRTLAASLESGRLTRRMRVALDRALLAGGGSPAREQQERNDELAERLGRVAGPGAAGAQRRAGGAVGAGRGPGGGDGPGSEPGAGRRAGRGEGAQERAGPGVAAR